MLTSGMNVLNGAKNLHRSKLVVIDYELLTSVARLLNNLRSKKFEELEYLLQVIGNKLVGKIEFNF
jgi:hypothetical protein